MKFCTQANSRTASKNKMVSNSQIDSEVPQNSFKTFKIKVIQNLWNFPPRLTWVCWIQKSYSQNLKINGIDGEAPGKRASMRGEEKRERNMNNLHLKLVYKCKLIIIKLIVIICILLLHYSSLLFFFFFFCTLLLHYSLHLYTFIIL